MVKLGSIQEKIKQKPDAIVFDFDDTILLGVQNIRHTAMEQVVKENGGEAAWDEYQTAKNTPKANGKKPLMNEALRMVLGEEKGKKLYEEDYSKKVREVRDAIEITDECRATLEELHAAGVPMFVVSSSAGDEVRHDAEIRGISDLFQGIYGRDELEIEVEGETKKCTKPDPLVVTAVLVNIKKSPRIHNVWLVGDGPDSDIQCAKDSGCLPVLFGTGKGQEQYAEANKDSVIYARDHAELRVALTQFRKHGKEVGTSIGRQ